MLAAGAGQEPLIRQQLARLIENRRFASAPKLSAFLQFVVEQTLAGQAGDIKEYSVALAVYGRRPDYDPKTDSIVRVEASRLRTRLKEYYEAEGIRDPILIELPKGSYVPTFRVDPPSEGAAPQTPFRRQPRWLILAGLLFVLATAAIVFLLISPRGVEPQPTITVLPFHNLSLDPANDTLTRVLTKDVEVQLTRSGVLRVIASGTADLAVEASVRRYEGRIRVVAQLLDRRDGAYVWSDTFDRDAADPPQSLTETARRIGTEVESQAMLATRQRAARGSPRGTALELYRTGRAQLRLKDDGFLLRGSESYERASLDAVSRAIRYLEQAVAADPSFAAGHATLATYYQMAGEIDVRMLDKAAASARRAIELDPNLGEAHATLGYIDFMFRWRFPEAAAEFRLALEREPRLLTTYRLYSDCLALLGRPDEAIRELDRARIVFPNHPVIEAKRVLARYYRGDATAMTAEAQRLVREFPTYPLSHWILGLALEQAKRYPEAEKAFEACLAISPADGRCTPALGHVLALAGDRAGAEKILEGIRNRPATQMRAPYEMALIQNALRQEDAAVASLQSAFDQREMGLPYLKTEPRLANLRGRAEVRSLLTKMGL